MTTIYTGNELSTYRSQVWQARCIMKRQVICKVSKMPGNGEMAVILEVNIQVCIVWYYHVVSRRR